MFWENGVTLLGHAVFSFISLFSVTGLTRLIGDADTFPPRVDVLVQNLNADSLDKFPLDAGEGESAIRTPAWHMIGFHPILPGVIHSLAAPRFLHEKGAAS